MCAVRNRTRHELPDRIITVGDSTRLTDYQEHTEVQHSFRTPGIHIATAQGEAGGHPITQEVKVVVTLAPAAR